MTGKKRIKLPPLDQIGIVVKDLEKTMKYYTDTFGIGPWRVIEVNRPEAELRGRKTSYKARIAFADMGTVEIELIQLISGRAIYSEFLEQGREGLHHLGFFLGEKEKEDLLKQFAAEGINVTEGSRTIMYRGSYSYLDTDKTGGVIIELVHREPK